MRKFICLIIAFFLLTGCNDESIKEVPLKTSNDNSAVSSPVNSHNLDEYMFRDDVQYVDLRSSKMILEEGYVAGFEFIPFYDLIASFSGSETLYRMENKKDDDGNRIAAGQVGSFVAIYEESEVTIKSMFSTTKHIFLISQGGSESSYLINLLIQLGYNQNLLYNVGGVSNSEGVASYRSIKTNKYYVEGYSGFNPTVDYDFVDTLTPVE